MLTNLYISNYALIQELEIGFENGLTIITGETGAGKSIIIGALSLILGNKAEAGIISDHLKKTVVEATFDITEYNNRLDDFFTAHELDNDPGECIVRRELNATGRSRCFINDTPVPLGVMRELSKRLIDIHSQHNNMLLSDASFQLEVIDSLANTRAILKQYQAVYAELKKTAHELTTLKEQQEKAQQEEDYIKFQLEQLTSLGLHENEDDELEARQQVLANVSSIKQALWNAQENLDGEETSIIDKLKEIEQDLAACESLDAIKGMSSRIESTVIELQDIASTIIQENEALNDDPSELATIEARLNSIYDLENKHHCNNVNELLAIQHAFEDKLNRLNNAEEQINQLQGQEQQLRNQATDLATAMSHKRQVAAATFASQLKALAQQLGLKNLAFTVEFSTTQLNAFGYDAVKFLFAFNKNQKLMQVKDTASGGEISRVMLCVKALIAQKMYLPTIVFDEVDTGVSGDVANMIGEVMDRMSSHLQVIAITHLPQVAAHGKHHLKVYKTDTAQETITSVKPLDFNGHVLEVARMLSGKNVDQAAINNATSLINACANASLKNYK